MFSDVTPHGAMSKLRIILIDISHTFKSHKGLPFIHHGLYVMWEGLPVTHEESVCHVP